MARRSTRRAWWLGAGVLAVAVAVPAVGAAGGRADRSEGTVRTSVTQSAASGTASGTASGVTGASVATQPIVGTDVEIPVPDEEIGSIVEDLAIPLQETEDDVVHGVAFYRPGPMDGSVIGGVSIVIDGTGAVRDEDGDLADVSTLAERFNPEIEADVTTIDGRTVLAWPDSEQVPSDGIPQEDRSVSRYAIVLDDAIAMVTFDDVPQASADAYLAELVGAL